MSLILPMKNEAADLERTFDAIDRQTYPKQLMEILVVDGGSSDGTVEMVAELMKHDSRIGLLGGPGVNTPLAMNLGIGASAGDLIAKVDGHGWINDRFIELAVQVLNGDPTIGCVGGRIEPTAETAVERANAYARFSRLGVGSGTYTAPNRMHETETVQCGVYRRSALEDVGTFDPNLAYGEDEELNYRLVRSGWKIIFHPGMVFSYRIRPSIDSLFRQYFRYGRARVAVVRKHPAFLRPKHTAPGLLVAGLMLSVPCAAFPRLRPVAVTLWAGYLAVVGVGALALAVWRRFHRPDLIAAALLSLHVGYGLGSLAGLVNILRRSEKQSANGHHESAEGLTGPPMERDGMADAANPEEQKR